jgi:hypothetical protein
MYIPKAEVACLLVIMALACAQPLGAISQHPPRAPRADLPTDRRQTHSQLLTSGQAAYRVKLGGHLDGAMTRMPVGYSAFRQGWQPELYVRLENVGETEVVNPWLTVNGRGDWRTVEAIVAEATAGCTTEADKARAIWEWQRDRRFHACTWDSEVSDAIKALNVYGYTLCGDDAQVLNVLWQAAGLKTRRGYPVGHVVVEAFYDGDYHLLDGDEHVICLRRDNRTIAGEAEIVRDHDLMKRTHTYSIGSPENNLLDQFSASLYGHEGPREGTHRNVTRHTMHFTLRPGERLEWRFSHVGKEYTAGKEPEPGKPLVDGIGNLLRGWGPVALDNMRNGKWVYRPPLEKLLYRAGTAQESNIAHSSEGDQQPHLHPRTAGQPAEVVWKVKSPYVLVGGEVILNYRRATAEDHLAVSVSANGKDWQPVWQAAEQGDRTAAITLDKTLSPPGRPMYEQWVKVEMQGGAGQVGLHRLTLDFDVQMALLAMPHLQVGENVIRYTDDSPGARQVRVTHAWRERDAWRPPTAPAQALQPAEGAAVEGTRLTFRWSPATSPDAEVTVADYHIQVCERPDLRWVISSNFDKLISLTPSKGKTEWTIPYVGLLNPDTTYYWRVRAQDSRGVWGPWSQRFSFRCRAPGVPLKVQIVPGEQPGTLDLTWEDNPEGRRPVAYKVYGSDEQGFTASDSEYVVRMGRGFCDTMEEFIAKPKNSPDYGDVKTPANLIDRVTARRLTVIGPEVNLPNTNRAFYRVAAVDEQGNESGPSDYAAAPRPWFVTRPPLTARAGQQYRYEPRALLSLGHLTCRTGGPGGSYNAAFWQREKLTYSLPQTPAWLRLEGSVLAGTPPATATGPQAVTLEVKNNRGEQARQEFTIVVTP